jgi:hypothetical protein
VLFREASFSLTVPAGFHAHGNQLIILDALSVAWTSLLSFSFVMDGILVFIELLLYFR